jgi:hypothetical protein
MRTRERPAPLVLVVLPEADAPFGSYTAVAETTQRLLSVELSQRLGRLGAAVVPLRPDGSDHWGRWFVGAVRAALASSPVNAIDAIGYAGAGALALLPDDSLDLLLSPVAAEVVANNRFSADAFVVAGDLGGALRALEGCATDNGAVRCLESAGFAARVVPDGWSRFDVDTPLDAALLRVAARLPSTRTVAQPVAAFLDMARLPGGRALEIPGLPELGGVVRDRAAELLVAGRVPASVAAYLESETACRVRLVIEERGMRSARDAVPRSLLAALLSRSSPADLVAELAGLADAVVLDTRVLMASLGGSSDEGAWPPAEERFASDFRDASPIRTSWLRELTEAASASPAPFLLGGHSLVSDGLRVLVEAAWSGH